MKINATDIDAVVLDLDGTLLEPNKNISIRTLNLLNQLQSDGIRVIVATGRTLRSASGYCSGLDFISPMVLANGTLVYDFKQRDYIVSHFQSMEVTEFLLQEATKGLKIQMYTTDKIFKNSDLSDTYGASDKYDDEYTFLIKDIYEYRNQVIKTLIINKESETAKFREIFLAKFYDKTTMVKTWVNCYEVQANSANKGNGLKHIAKTYNIDLSKTIAIGDADNDIELLKTVGYPIAMKNASNALKDEAKEIIGSNDEDGVYHFLNTVFST